jgi:tRNA1Val (adenine37-N6)-methyltransferase
VHVQEQAPAQLEGDEGGVTSDALLRGRVRLFQPRRGARTSLDPVLLAGFLGPPYGRFLDIGCGTGALAFLLLARDAAASGVAVELQPHLQALAVRGRDDNGWRERLEVLEGDVRALASTLGSARFDLVATNPPYRTVGEGLPSPIEERALAHHEIALALSEWLDVAARAVRPGGRVAAILPASRTVDLCVEMRARDLAPVRLRAVHPYADRPASRVLVETERGSRRSLTIDPPLVVHVEGARYTPEVLQLLGED